MYRRNKKRAYSEDIYNMEKYQNGLETQTKILDTCRKLFYLKGYDKTTFLDICKETNVNQSAIHYHFKSKENILHIILKETIQKNNQLVEFYSDRSTCFLAKLFFDVKLYLYKIYHDEKYRRFYINATRFWYNLDRFVIGDPGRLSYNHYSQNKVEKEKQTLILDEEQKFSRMACTAFDQIVLHYMDENINTIEFASVYKQVINMYKKILEISDDEYKLAKEHLEILESRCKWEEIETTL